MIHCPKCDSTHFWKIGSIPTAGGLKQRYMCIPKGHKFVQGKGKPVTKRKTVRRRAR